MTRTERAIVATFAGAVLLLGALLLEERILSTSAQGIVVTILSVESPQQAEGPPEFRYRVALPDGSEARFHSGRMYRASTRVRATYSKGRITRIVRLRDPSSAVAEVP